MSSHFKNVNIKIQSCKDILQPTISAFLCSSEVHEIDFAWIFQVNWQLGGDQVWAFRIPVGHRCLAGNRVGLSEIRESINQTYNQRSFVCFISIRLFLLRLRFL